MPGAGAECGPLSSSHLNETNRVHCGIGSKNLIEIGSGVSEIWPGKVKSRECIYSSRHVYSAKYGTSPNSTLYINSSPDALLNVSLMSP